MQESWLLVPLLALAGLWAFVATITLGNRIRFQHYEALANATAPTTAPLEADLLAERALTLTWLGSGGRGLEAQVLAIRHKTDAAVVAARGAYNLVSGRLAPTGLIEMRTFFADLATLPRIRAGVDSGADSVAAAYRSYDTIATALAAFLQTSAPTDDPTLNDMTQAADSAARLEDRISGAMSLIGAALAAGGRIPQPERVLLAEVIGQQLDLASIFRCVAPGRPADLRQCLRHAHLPPVPGDGKPGGQQLAEPAHPGEPAGIRPACLQAAIGNGGPAEPDWRGGGRAGRAAAGQPDDPAGPGRRPRPGRGRRLRVRRDPGRPRMGKYLTAPPRFVDHEPAAG